MLIDRVKPTPSLSSSKSPKEPVEVPQNEADSDNIWSELFSGELNEIGMQFSAENINNTVDAAYTVGEGLRKTWDSLGEKLSKYLDLDPNNRIFPEGSHAVAMKIFMGLAHGVGYTAAGLQGLGGLYKVHSGWKEKNLAKEIDGVFDLTTSAAVGTTVAGAAIGPAILAPVAAVMGIVRGGYNVIKGFLLGDSRREIQGALDATRSASVGFRMSASHSAALGTAGRVLGPIAGAIQAARGFYDLQSGLELKDKKKQVRGLTDVAAATGLTLALSGAGTIPGIALTAVAMGSRFLYQLSDKFAAKCDKKLDKWEPGLQKTVNLVSKVAQPVISTGRKVIEKIFGHKKGEHAHELEEPNPPDPEK